MSGTTIKARLIVRNATTDQWSTSNPVLLPGEPGFDSEKKELKIGDGSTQWSELSPVSGIAANLPIASDDTIGGVKAKTKDTESVEIAVDAEGKLWAPQGSYTLPIANGSTLGGVLAKPKTNESIEIAVDETGKLWAPAGAVTTLPVATSEVLGGVLSSEDQDYVKVEEDGKLKLNRISATLLVNEVADDFVLDGGGAE